jgi:hypothetical protein
LVAGLNSRVPRRTHQKQKDMKQSVNPLKIEALKQQLREVRNASLLATRQGDYKQIARLTTEAASLNKAIIEAEGLLLVSQM